MQVAFNCFLLSVAASFCTATTKVVKPLPHADEQQHVDQNWALANWCCGGPCRVGCCVMQNGCLLRPWSGGAWGYIYLSMGGSGGGGSGEGTDNLDQVSLEKVTPPRNSGLLRAWSGN
mmetsp:Transcript_33307/g.33802  ORF Transcript_33307/g.33802 Transcript_33307/m.33802 type:complete len:118 (+) Transcript_33307:14-367(+)